MFQKTATRRGHGILWPVLCAGNQWFSVRLSVCPSRSRDLGCHGLCSLAQGCGINCDRLRRPPIPVVPTECVPGTSNHPPPRIRAATQHPATHGYRLGYRNAGAMGQVRGGRAFLPGLTGHRAFADHGLGTHDHSDEGGCLGIGEIWVVRRACVHFVSLGLSLEASSRFVILSLPLPPGRM